MGVAGLAAGVLGVEDEAKIVRLGGVVDPGDGAAPGAALLSDGGTPINIPQNAEVTIGNDGTVSATIGNQPSTTIGRIKLATPTADDPLQRSPDGLFRTASGNPLPQDGTAKVMVGVLEGSNVNAIETMVGMIQTARQFEAQMQLIQSAESNDRSASQLFSVAG